MRHDRTLRWLFLTGIVTLVLGSFSNFSVSAQTAEPNQPSGNTIYLPAAAKEGEDSTLTVDAVVERIESTYEDGFVVSRAILLIEHVVAGNYDGERIVVFYLGGTVGDVIVVASHEPVLSVGMHIRATVQKLESGEYGISNVDEDLAILSSVQPTFTPFGWTWSDSSMALPLQINANTPDVAGTGEQIGVVNAINTWNIVSGAYFRYSQSSGSCGNDINDLTNCVTWVNSVKPGATDEVYASTFWRLNGDSTEFVEMDLIFWEQSPTVNITWSTGTSPNASDADIETFALHELGHGLGLDHSLDSSAVMYKYVPIGVLARSLNSDDIKGVRDLYTLTDAYVDSNAATTGICTSSNQCNTVSWGVTKVADNGTVHVAAGTYSTGESQPLIINRPMTLMSNGGTVTIGP